MTPDSETEAKVAETVFCWLDYENYGAEQNAIKAFRRRKGMSRFDAVTVREWLAAAVRVRTRLDQIKAEIAESYGKPSHVYLATREFQEGTETLTARLNEEFPEMKATVAYMVSMAWCMYYYR
jgi:hypothetical protein